MDLKRPSHSLKTVKELVEKGKITPNLHVTKSAHKLGFSETEVYDEILKLERHNFCKSTNEYYNHKVWLDVYKKTIRDIPIYIKFKLVNDSFLLSSFKVDTDKEK